MKAINTMRFLLGLADAGFFPGIVVYLTHWFIYEDRTKAVAAFMAAISLLRNAERSSTLQHNYLPYSK